MPSRVPNFYEFEELVDNLFANVMEKCPESRSGAWKHQAHQYVIENAVDVGIVKLALDRMDDNKKYRLIDFESICEFFLEELNLESEMLEPEYQMQD